MLLQLHHCLYTGAEEPRRGGGWEFGPQLELGIYIGFFFENRILGCWSPPYSKSFPPSLFIIGIVVVPSCALSLWRGVGVTHF